MKISMIASGSKGNACLIETGNKRILIDCGTTKRYLTQSFAHLNMSFDDIDVLLITHDHSDHTSQIKHFKNAVVYSPKDSIYRHVEVIPYQSFVIEKLEVLPIKTSHDDEDSVGYVIQSEGKKLVYITDTGYVRTQDFEYIRDANYYIMESNHDPELLMQTNRPYHIKRRILSDEGHLSNDDAARVLQEVVGTNTQEIILAHLSGEANTAELALDTVTSHVSSHVNVKVAQQFEIVLGGNHD